MIRLSRRTSWCLLMVVLLSCPMKRMGQAEAMTITRRSELQQQHQVVHVNEHALLQVTVEIHSLGGSTEEEDLQVLLLHTRKNHHHNHMIWTVLVEPVVSTGSTSKNDRNQHQNHLGTILERNVTEWTMLDSSNNIHNNSTTATSQLLFWMSLPQPFETTTETTTTPTVPHLVSLFLQDNSSTTTNNNHKRLLQTRRLVQVPVKSSSSSSSSPVLSVHLTASLASSSSTTPFPITTTTPVGSSFCSSETSMLAAKTTMICDPSREDVTTTSTVTATTTSTDDWMWTLMDMLLSCMSSFGIYYYILEWIPHAGVKPRRNGTGTVVIGTLHHHHHQDASQSWCESSDGEEEEEHDEYHDESGGQSPTPSTSQGQSPTSTSQGQNTTSTSQGQSPTSASTSQGQSPTSKSNLASPFSNEYRESPSSDSSSSSSDSSSNNSHDDRNASPPPPSVIRDANPIQKHNPLNPSCESSSPEESGPPQGRQAHDPDVTAIATNDNNKLPNQEPPTNTTKGPSNNTTLLLQDNGGSTAIGTYYVGSQTITNASVVAVDDHGNGPETQKKEAIMDVSLLPLCALVETTQQPLVRTTTQEPTSWKEQQQQHTNNSIAKSAVTTPANNTTSAEPSPLVSTNVRNFENLVSTGEDFFNGVIEILDNSGGGTQESSSYPQRRQGEVLTQYSDTLYSQNNILASPYETNEEPSLFNHQHSPYGFNNAVKYKDSPPFGPGPSPLVSNNKNQFHEPILTQRRQIEAQAVDQSVGIIDGHSNTPLESVYGRPAIALQGLEVDKPAVSSLSEKDQVGVSKHTEDNGLGSTMDAKKDPDSQTATDGDVKTNAGDTQAIDLQPKKETRMLEDTGTFSIASKIEAQERHPESSASAFKSALDRNDTEGSPCLKEAYLPANSYGTYPSELHATQKELKTFHAPREMNAPSDTTKICPPGQLDPPSIPPTVLPSKDSNRADDELGPEIDDNASVSESYVSTLPPDSDCSSEGSVENLDFTSDNQDSSERKAVSSFKRSHSTVASKNEAPKSRRSRRMQTNIATKKHNALKRNDVNSKKASDLGESSQQRDNPGTRSAKRPPLQDRLNARTPPSVAFSARSNTPGSTRRKRGVKHTTTRKRPRGTPEPELPAFKNDSDSVDSVEILGFSLPTPSKKPRPFSKSSIVPDWVPSTGLQSISQQFQDDMPWNIIADKPLSNPKEVPIKLIVLPYK